MEERSETDERGLHSGGHTYMYIYHARRGQDGPHGVTCWSRGGTGGTRRMDTSEGEET